jgi:hypothetical protein
MKTRKTKTVKKEWQRKYAKPVSLYPLKPEDAISAFMKVNPKKIMAKKKVKKS